MEAEMTAAEYNATVKKGNKFGAQPTEVDGFRFASKAEARRYRELKLMEQAGEIESLVLQPKLTLNPNGVHVGTYVADFLYWDLRSMKPVYEDVKGVKTPVYRLKKKLVKALYGIEIQEVSG